MIATSYCTVGRTQSGTFTHYGTVAVDPRIIPMHSHLRIIVKHAGNWLDRFARTAFRAEDTGGAIQGARIDIWQSSCSEALAWGRRTVLVSLREDVSQTNNVKNEAQERAKLSRKLTSGKRYYYPYKYTQKSIIEL